MRLARLCSALIDDPNFMRKFHGWATVLWILASIPISIWLNQSIPLLVFISVYAIVMGHWGTWQSCRVEVKQDKSK